MPSDRVLAQVAVPRIRSYDSSVALRRPARVRGSGPRPPVDLPALAAALDGARASRAETCADPLLTSREQVSVLERRLRQHERELAAARDRVAELGAASAGDC